VKSGSAVFFVLGFLSSASPDCSRSFCRRDNSAAAARVFARNSVSAGLLHLFPLCFVAGELALSTMPATVLPRRISPQSVWRPLLSLRFTKVGCFPQRAPALPSEVSGRLDHANGYRLTSFEAINPVEALANRNEYPSNSLGCRPTYPFCESPQSGGSPALCARTLSPFRSAPFGERSTG
jgi:hypothetical protein